MNTPAATGRDPLAGKIPVTVITGFLGSGKTTLLARLLRHPGMNRAAVIINEFGEIGIDHELLQSSSEQTTLLDNGCLCCVLRTDLQETLRDLFIRRRSGEVIDFDRVFIETSGLADPAPVAQTLVSDTMLAAHFRLDGIVTLADAVNGAQQLTTFAEPLKQAAIADRILITKTDIAPAQAADDLKARLREINAQALLGEVVNGEIDPAQLTGIGLTRARAGSDEVSRWLGPLPAAGGNLLGAATHTSGVQSFCLWYEQPFTWDAFTQCMQVLTALRGPDLLRVKGLVNVAGSDGPVVVQGVQHVFHPPATLAQWPSADRRTRLVFITRGIEQATVANLFAAVGAVAASAPKE